MKFVPLLESKPAKLSCEIKKDDKVGKKKNGHKNKGKEEKKKREKRKEIEIDSPNFDLCACAKNKKKLLTSN